MPTTPTTTVDIDRAQESSQREWLPAVDMGAVGVEASMASDLEAGPGASPRAALHELKVEPIPTSVARHVVVRHHYLGSWPGGTFISFGVFRGPSLVGLLTLGAGRSDLATLTRMWLADALPPNTASRVLGIVARALRRNTELKFLVTYADPAQGHVGSIYQAANWVYTGLSAARCMGGPSVGAGASGR